jgi:peptide chain release factor 1
MLPRDKINALVTRVEAIDQRLLTPLDSDTLVKLSKERAELQPVYEAIGELTRAEKDRAGLDVLMGDPEMGAMAEEEARELDGRIEALGDRVRKLLIPKDAADE